MKKWVHLPVIPANIALGLLMCVGLYVASLYNYLLFHTIAESFSIVVACGMFMVAWNSRRFFENNYLLFVGIAYLFVGILDFVHTLAYQGMGIFPGDNANHATQLWIAARYAESLSLIFAPFFLRRRLKIPAVLAGYAAAVGIVLVLIVSHVFPDCFLPGTGLTPFKRISEYIISLILIGAAALLVRNRRHFDNKVFSYVVLSIVLTVAAELFFTFYVSVYGLSNFVGHVLKILSFYLIYKAVIETGLARPYDLLFRSLKQSEESLKQQREWLNVTLSSIGEGLIATDNEGKITFMNPVAVKLTGWRRRDAIGKPVDAVFRTLDERKECGADFISRVLSEKQAVGLVDNPVLCADDGREIPIEHNAAPIMTDNGSTSGVVIVFHDVTEKRRNEDELRKVNEQLEVKVQERTATLKRQADLLNLTHDAIFVRDREGHITFWNQGATEMYGWSEEEAVGRISATLLETAYPQPLSEIESRVFSEGRWEGELVHTRRDGAHITVATRWALEKGEKGEPLRILEINNDITEQKNAERQLRQAQKQEALGVLAGGIAHDFNNILAAIMGFTEMILDRVPPESREYRHATRVVQAGLRGRELIRQMLTFSRKTDEVKRPIDLSGIVKETVKLLRASIPATIDINVAIRNEEGSLVLGDPVHMEQVLMNLSTNAAHAMRGRGGTLSIELSDYSVPSSGGDGHGAAPGTYVRLVVRDTGTGIPQDIIERVFDPFFTTKAVGEGTGLGLSVVLGIVKQSQGIIAIDSRIDEGTAFTIYFPRVKKTEGLRVHTPTKTIPTGDERILFVDDEEALIEMGELMLGGLGYMVASATSGERALEVFTRNPSAFDLVITDQTMPHMTGVELAAQILSIRPDVPVILCTGFSYLVDEESAKAAGIKAFVMKPLTKREIAKTVREVLDS